MPLWFAHISGLHPAHSYTSVTDPGAATPALGLTRTQIVTRVQSDSGARKISKVTRVRTRLTRVMSPGMSWSPTLWGNRGTWSPTFWGFYFGPPLFGPPVLRWSPAFSDHIFLVPHFGRTVPEVGTRILFDFWNSRHQFQTVSDLEI